MRDIDLLKFYKTIFNQQELELTITFEKFHEQVGKYVKDMGYDLDQEVAARLVAQKYKTKQYQKIQINQLSQNMSRNICISGLIETLSPLQTSETKEKITEYKYLVLKDNTGKTRVTFWQTDIALLSSIYEKQQITVYGYVSCSARFGTLLRPCRLEVNQSQNTLNNKTMPINISKIQEIEDKAQIGQLKVKVLDCKQTVKYSKQSNRQICLYSYLLQDQSAMVILS